MRGREIRGPDLAANGRGRNFYYRIVANSFVLSGVISSHHVKLFVFLGKPNGSVNRDAVFAESSEAYVFLVVQFRGKRIRHNGNSNLRCVWADE